MKKQTKKAKRTPWPTWSQLLQTIAQAKAQPYTGVIRHTGSAY